MNPQTVLVVAMSIVTGVFGYLFGWWRGRFEGNPLGDNDPGLTDSLPPFDRTKPCPKCGAAVQHVQFKYRAPRHPGWFGKGRREHMQRFCAVCTAVWYETTLRAGRSP